MQRHTPRSLTNTHARARAPTPACLPPIRARSGRTHTPAACHPCSRRSPHSPQFSLMSEGAVPSAFELQRLQHIAANNQRLKASGLCNSPRAPKPHNRRPLRATTTTAAASSPRRSGRLQAAAMATQAAAAEEVIKEVGAGCRTREAVGLEGTGREGQGCSQQRRGVCSTQMRLSLKRATSTLPP